MKESSVTYNEGLFYMLKGLAHIYLREFELGIISNKKALSILEESEQKQYAVGTLTNLGILYREVKNYKLSIKCIEKSISLSIENSFELYLINNYFELSITYIRINNLEKAEEICKNQIVNTNKFSSYKVKMILLLSFIKLKGKAFEESLKYVNDAEEHSLKINDELLTAKTFTLKSQILSEQGCLKESNEYLKKAIQIYKYKNSYESLDFI
jgi:tetratricopeptide (TPR) repeat protein